MENLIGKTFGKIYVLNYAGKNKFGKNLWRCKCECLNEKIIENQYLKSTENISCGCYQKELKTKNIAGKTINRIYVIEQVGTDKYNHSLWRCKCYCGKEFIAVGSRLTMKSSQRTQSCGCRRLETSKENIRKIHDRK